MAEFGMVESQAYYNPTTVIVGANATPVNGVVGPHHMYPMTQVGSGGPFTGGVLSNTWTTIAQTAGKVATAAGQAYGRIQDARLVSDLNQIRNDAILRTAKNSPTAIQMQYPGFTTAMNDADSYGASVTDVSLRGLAAQTLGDIPPVVLWGGLGFLVWQFVR